MPKTRPGGPSSARCPWPSSTATRSISPPSSSRRCSTSSSERPRAAARRRRRARRAPAGSRLAVGSSATRACGPMASTAARVTRCLAPPERASRRAGVRSPASPTAARAAATLRRISSGGTPRHSSPKAISSSTSSITSCVSGSWNSTPTRPARSPGSARRVSWPSRSTRPGLPVGLQAVGDDPVEAQSQGALPAPAGPQEEQALAGRPAQGEVAQGRGPAPDVAQGQPLDGDVRRGQGGQQSSGPGGPGAIRPHASARARWGSSSRRRWRPADRRSP